jgi:glycosyltransferase involved in cell wall biosynthesis
MLNNKVTIGLPFYNNAETLKLAIESVILQSYTNWELILINDGSTDGSDLIAKNYSKAHDNIRYINDAVNRGLVYRLNQIIDLTETQFLARMDADDVMFCDRIEKQVSILNKNKEYDVVSSGAIIINQKNQITGMRDCFPLDNFTYINLFSKSFIIHPTAIFRTNWIKLHRYSPDYIRAEDLELWCRTFYNLKLFRIAEPLLFYREGDVNINNYVLSMRTKLKIIENYGFKIMSKNKIFFIKIITNLKIFIYVLFGIFNFQFFLSNFRNKIVPVKSVILFENYINSLKNKLGAE